ncbi:HAD hydrolase-like protein [Candidatus Dependentiae bacterium]|nr:HAD hydrolase-like protein [Candidatus Dependentiae bacterium]
MAQSLITNIIWDLGGTLFTPDLKHVNQQPNSSYGLLTYVYGGYKQPNHANTIDTQIKAIEILNRLGKQQPGAELIRLPNGQPAPQVVVDWLAGTISNEEALKGALEHYYQTIKEDADFIPDGEKHIVKSMLYALFSPETLIECMQVVKPMAQLLAECAQNNNYTLYVLSNWDKPSFELLYKSFQGQNIFKYFKKENILISSMVGLIKPQKKIYEYFIEHYSIDPKQSVFIDNQVENIQAAQAHGIASLLFKPNGTQELREQLKALGVI